MAQKSFYVETTPPETRKPPIVETGILGWLRENLFSSWWNTLLTIVASAFVVWAIIGFISWSIQQANWAVITNNLHLFAIGTYPQDLAWRPLVSTLFLMFLTGLTWRMLGQASRLVVVLGVIIVVLLYVFPAIAAPLPYPDTYVLIGGPLDEPLAAMAYVGQEGETVTFTLDPIQDFTADPPAGFIDRTSLTVAGLGRQEARARLRAVNEAIESGEQPPENVPEDAILAIDEETGQIITLERDLTATVTILQVPFEETIDEETGETVIVQDDPVELATLSAGPEAEPVSIDLTFPETGWYLIVPERDGEIGGFWLEMSAIAPMLPTVASANEQAGLYGETPTLEGKRVQVLTSSYIPFRGLATLQDFIKLYLGPFSDRLKDFTLVAILATAAGYLLVVGAQALGKERWDESWQAQGRRAMIILWLISPVVFFLLLHGVGTEGSLQAIEFERWGGLLLTMVLTVVGIVVAFPIGVLLALGRRSELPVVRVFSTLSIELVRGVPLVTILFAASILVPLVDPSLSGVDNVIRAMVGMTFFSAAYLAEIVRGGLQAIPSGQTEAAKALGMSGWQITLLIVLPQALRAVIPAIMGQFVSLFKDTSLVLIIGLLDLLGIARSVINQAEYIGLQRETLVFISVIYFVLSYLMSWGSRRIEQTGSGAVRRA